VALTRAGRSTSLSFSPPLPEDAATLLPEEAGAGLGRIVALCCHSFTLYHIH
jgi:hypothetical protein